ncbi:MAG: ATP-binding protein [Treponemataceae bacterium]
MLYRFEVPGDDFSRAGHASTEIKRIMQQLGLPLRVIKRTTISMYEAEINMVVHAGGGVAEVEIGNSQITVVLRDSGPGIPDLELAMTEGWSTAPEWIREMGFGAGMGLSNMKRNTDEMSIDTVVGKGTTVTLRINVELGAS